MNGGEFCQKVTALIESVEQTQSEAFVRSAELIYGAVTGGGSFYVTGTGHSHMIAEEWYARAGGLAPVSLMVPPEFMMHQHPLKSTLVERMASYVDVIFGIYTVRENDAVFICSNSGRNGLIVELAIGAKARGAHVIALTSRAHSMSQPSRHESGRRLMDVADIVIDNCGAVGDSCHRIPGGPMMGATSTIAGAYVVQRIAMLVAGLFIRDGKSPPVFQSSNVDGSEEANAALFEQYYNINRS